MSLNRYGCYIEEQYNNWEWTREVYKESLADTEMELEKTLRNSPSTLYALDIIGW